MRIASAVVVFSCLLASCHAKLALVEHGKSRYEIIRPEDATRVVRLAAEELQHFVEQSTGVRLPVVAEPTAGMGHIFLGPNPASAVAGVTPDDLAPEGFHLKTVGQDIHIVGADTEGDPRTVGPKSSVQCGTLNGVYELLERCVGVMFCWHDDLGTVVPRRQELVIPELDFTDAPDWSYRTLAYSPSDATRGVFGRRLRLGHPFTISHSHAWFKILPVEQYGEEHPEYFAEIKGERQPRYYSEYHGGQVCTSNPEVIEIFARAAIEYFNQHPERHMFSVSPNDGGGFCECESCRALDGGDMLGPEQPDMPVLTDRMLAFYSAIAERLVKVYPDKLLGGYVYSSYKKPPRREKPHPNVFLVNATNSAHAHGVNWETEHEWERQWTALTPRFYKYDMYFGRVASLHIIAPVTTHLIEKVKAEHEVGIKGGRLYMGQSYEQLGAGHYLLAKLMWDKNADARELERRYYNALYGAAGPDVLAYYHLLEDRLRKMYLDGVDVDEPAVTQGLMHKWVKVGSPGYILAAYWPILDQATSIIQRAGNRQLSEVEGQRFARLIDHHEFLVATVRGMIAAGRLEQQAQFNPDDIVMLKQGVEQREAAKSRMAAYAPTLMEYLPEAEKAGTARVSPDGAFYQLARPSRPVEVVVVKTDAPPRIDGHGNDAVWRRAPLNYLVLARSAVWPQLGARVALAFDSENLYVFVEGREEDTATLARATRARDSRAVFDDDTVELFLQPLAGNAYYHVALGAGGALYDSAHPTGTAEESDLSWDSQAKTAVHIAATGWSAEMAVPFAPLGAIAKDAGEWRVNVCRTRRGAVEPDEYTAVSATFGRYHVPSRFARLVLADSADAPRFQYGTFDEVPGEALEQELRFGSKGKATVELTSERAYCGSRSAHITVEKGSYGSITLEAKAKPNASYRALIAHYNTLAPLRPLVRDQVPNTRVIFRDDTRKAVTPTTGYSWDGAHALEKPNQWRITPHTFTTPEGTTQISLSIFFHHPGEYWVDEVRLEEL